MSARFAELCRTPPMRLETSEAIAASNALGTLDCLACDQDIFIGFFFDGTNNNKYRDTVNFAQSNVARLYEVFPGQPTAKQLKLTAGNVPNVDFPPDWPAAVKKIGEQAYYRKTYVPGVGTPFVELGDTGAGMDATLGLAMAKYGEIRLDWALLQVANHIHQALMHSDLSDPLDADCKAIQQLNNVNGGQRAEARFFLHKERNSLLAKKIADRLKAKPRIRSIRLSVFGFSRGAAEARVFCNWVLNFVGTEVAGIPLHIDFLGIFDTVASVGLANSAPILGADGHYSWATPGNLKVSSAVKRCAHLVAGHEVRGSFPLDSAGSGNNVKEVVYPGVHSDVGGGYPPNDQGRAIGAGSVGDAKKLSQIPLAQMYREALIAGVPLLPESEWIDLRRSTFKIDSTTISAFNAYVAATRNGEGKPNGSLWLTETQPLEPIKKIMHRHYGLYLRWRKSMLGKVHTLPGLTQSLDPANKKTQDIHDLKITDEALQKELASLRKHDSARQSGDSIEMAMTMPLADKLRDWANGVRDEYDNKTELPLAAKTLFETLVHDSRAWFKPLGADDDVASLKKYQQQRIQELEREIAARQNAMARVNDPVIIKHAQELNSKAQATINDLKQDKTYVVADGGHEFYWMWGYLRWRIVFESNHPSVDSKVIAKEAAKQRRLPSRNQTSVQSAL